MRLANYPKRKSAGLVLAENEFVSVLDSGSVETMANASKTFPKHPVSPSPGSPNGVKYVAADGGLMPNNEEITTTLQAENGVKLENMKWQDTELNMPIMSVRRLAKKGSRVEFHDTGGNVYLPDGNVIPFYLIHGVYLIKLLITPPDGSDQPPFGGPGA